MLTVGTLPASNVRGLAAIELRVEHADLLQRFFHANPEYFLEINGAPAGRSAGRDEINDLPASEFSYSQRWVLGYLDRNRELAAVASVVRDLFVTGVWHIGMFIVETARHGRGDAQAIHEGIARWAVVSGARWLRLAVVRGHARAERFWESLGYAQVSTRDGIQLGDRLRTLRVMVKPLGTATVGDFLLLVPRDRPGGQ
jgi:GNAT superfamily N-acetyltransferase